MENNLIVVLYKILIHTATTDNEASTAKSADLFTNQVKVVRCLVRIISLAGFENCMP